MHTLLQINKTVICETNIIAMQKESLSFRGSINSLDSPPRALLPFPHMLGLASLQHCLLFEQLSVEGSEKLYIQIEILIHAIIIHAQNAEKKTSMKLN